MSKRLRRNILLASKKNQRLGHNPSMNTSRTMEEIKELGMKCGSKGKGKFHDIKFNLLTKNEACHFMISSLSYSKMIFTSSSNGGVLWSTFLALVDLLPIPQKDKIVLECKTLRA
ncbi:hypothetical protein BpHYR1_006499 [Brachionus plicatilis]|uniref:Uncharacterized protein n=1 Tax=Brachionus plicatilis TaxID=10195 RepID=A0A3M7Q2T4_BRAPC|nr:hypothetical protein BpHYR1_006499 [Brachionus plicatilis]